MKLTQDKYPHFEANQVLTSSHLNQVFDYMDEHERLTRANLIGIGIVCGLNFDVETSGSTRTIHLNRGVGVGSAGYLLNEPDNIALVSYREYLLPNEIEYPAFMFEDGGVMKQYPLWEMFPAGEPNTQPLGNPSNFLNDKVFILFLELKLEGLRNCSPNNCNDQGEEVTATLRHLLIRIVDLEKIIAIANNLEGDLTVSDLGESLLARLNLPDIKLQRWDAPNTYPLNTLNVLKGFHHIFTSDKISEKTGNALSAAYLAFRPLIETAYSENPFNEFALKFGFLDSTTLTVNQLKFIQYYYGFFEDLLNAYDEFRWKGVKLMCDCSPSEGLFPRHLMLGPINPPSVAKPGIFRSHFMPSPAVSNCEDKIRELQMLFVRLVEMMNKFTDSPPLPPSGQTGNFGFQIRVTPDKLADVGLSAKAIPYYYLQNGPPHLFKLWNYEKTSRGRANQNLSYRSDEYNPAAPAFVTNPLRYDLETYNFLRIEGHLGTNYQSALYRILSLKRQYRLPVDVIALRTGTFDEKLIEDIDRQSCHFTDLESQYDRQIGEIIGFLGMNLRYFYDLFYPPAKGLLTSPTPSKLPWFAQWDPDFRVKPNTLGAYFEVALWSAFYNQPYYNPDSPVNSVLQFIGDSPQQYKELIIIYIIYYIARFPEVLSSNLADINLTALNEREDHLTRVAEAIEIKREHLFIESQKQESVVSWEDLDDRLEDIVYGDYSDSIRALYKEYKIRLIEVNKKLYLGHYLQSNPGIQHKAGVPMGGTFILVYHGERADGSNLPPQTGNFTIRGLVMAGHNDPMPGAVVLVKGTNTGTSTNASGNFELRTNQLPLTLRVNMLGFSSFEKLITKEGFYVLNLHGDNGMGNDENTTDFFNGEVIADFYLPYLCCSDCPPTQFVLPVIPPSLRVEIGCTDEDGTAVVILTPLGGTPPYNIKVDEGSYIEMMETITLSPGKYKLTLQDGQGLESAPQNLIIPEMLMLSEPGFDCSGDNNQYVAVIEISGGTPPYTPNRGRILENQKTFYDENFPGDTDIEIIITDGRGCTASTVINHSCGPELSFTARIGCTNVDDIALVEVIASGGQAPYEVRVNTANYIPINEPLSLKSGKYDLTVRDAKGNKTATQSIEIPTELKGSEPEFECTEDGKQYRVKSRITGGLPPYTANRGSFEGDVYTSDLLPSDTDVEIIVYDSRKCNMVGLLNHTCTLELSFTVNIGCASPNGSAMVEVIPFGGKAPYEIQTGAAPFVPLTGPLSLPIGDTLLTLRDADGQTASQTITVPQPLTLAILNLSCESDNKFYRASIRISGGMPPYIADGVAITGTDFLTKPVASGQSATIVVIDSKKCQTSIQIQHTCETPCELPCNGETLKCAYRLWVQPPQGEQLYKVYNILEGVNFTFNGDVIILPDEAQILQLPAAMLNQNFENAIARALDKLNKAINEALIKELGSAGNNRLRISYKPSKTDPFSIFNIEHFVCDTFKIDFIYRFAKPSPQFEVEVQYTNIPSPLAAHFNGAIFTNLEQNEKVSVVPAFDCSKRNLCTGSEYKNLCEGNTLKPDFTITPGDSGLRLESTTPGSDLRAWIWDIFGTVTSEPFYTGVKTVIQVKDTSGSARLIVISNKGCFAFKDKPLKG
ncbi:hypothetical protein MASR1M74_00610 [Lentimicrobium sp.]